MLAIPGVITYYEGLLKGHQKPTYSCTGFGDAGNRGPADQS